MNEGPSQENTSVPFNNPTNPAKGLIIGLLGAILLSVLETFFPTDDKLDPSIKQKITLAIPGVSYYGYEVLLWIWECLKPQNAQSINYRKQLKKQEKEKEIKKLLKTNIPEDYRKQLDEKLAEIGFARINSFVDK